MRKINFKKLTALLLCLLMLSSLPSVVAAAEEAPEKAPNVEWLLSDDAETLTASTGKVYKAITVPADVYLAPKSRYEYANTVDLPEEDDCFIYSTSPDNECVWVETFYSGDKYLYATEAGKAALNAFLNDSDTNVYRLYSLSDIYFGYLNASLLTALDGSSERVTFDVRELADWECYELSAHDSTEIVARDYGLIFESPEGKLFYVRFDTLDNTHFDANGNFSFRSGEVPLTPLNDAMSAEAREALNARMTEDVTVYEDPTLGELPETLVLILFWIVYVILGFLCPLPFIAVGVILPLIKPLGKPKYWLLSAILGALWVLLAIILMILLIVA